MRNASGRGKWAGYLAVLALLAGNPAPAGAAPGGAAPAGEAPGAEGPGVPRITFAQNELWKILAELPSKACPDSSRGHKGEGRGQNLAFLHQGYLGFILAPDHGWSCGGIQFLDISNPRKPVSVRLKDDAETFPMRESHGIGFHSHGGRDYAVTQAEKGIIIWDWTDLQKPTQLKYLQLPGAVESDYDKGVWAVHWQAPYVFAAGGSTASTS